MLHTTSYSPYGVPDGLMPGRFAYTGQAVLPGLDLYHYKARVYSPTLGRFLQTDPIGYEDQQNWYAYVGNDPMNYIDPTGMCSEENSGSSILCGVEDWIHNNISLPISNWMFDRADDVRESRGLPPVERVDLGGEAAQSYEAEFTSIENEVRQVGGRIAEAAVESRNPMAVARNARGLHGNDRRSKRPTDLYHLVDRDDGSLLKIGITSRGEKRYTKTFLRANNAEQITMFTFSSRYPAIVAENIELTFYRIEHGQLPPLNRTTR